MVTNELRGEKVDIVPFSEDPAEFVMRALQPAKVKEVRLDEETGTATVIVHDYQLSLAIGKEGQNARLAARLTGWRIDIKSETQLAEEEAGYTGEEWAQGEWVENEAGEMVWKDAEGGEMSAEQWEHAGDAPEAGAGGGAGGAAGGSEPRPDTLAPETSDPAETADNPDKPDASDVAAEAPGSNGSAPEAEAGDRPDALAPEAPAPEALAPEAVAAEVVAPEGEA
jgi:N utilization substance protein A